MTNQNPPIPPLAVSIDEAASACGVSRRHLYALIGRGQLRTIKLGTRRLVPVSELEALIAGEAAA